MRKVFSLAFAALILWPAYQSVAATQVPLAVIHYRVLGKLVAFPVRVNNGPPALFYFDSGARHVVIDPRLSDRLGLKPIATGTLQGTGNGDVAIKHLAPVAISIGSISIRADDPWVVDLSHVPIDKNTRGLIGADILQRYVVRIDPQARTFSLFDPATFVPGDETVLPLIAKDNRYFVDATIDVKPGLRVTERLRIDTGSEDSVNDAIVAQARKTKRTVLGNGLGTNFEAFSGMFDAVHLGPYTWHNVWGPGGTRPAIGMELLRRFAATFDVSHGRLFLRPNSALNQPVPGPN
jgi:hypothetical protein